MSVFVVLVYMEAISVDVASKACDLFHVLACCFYFYCVAIDITDTLVDSETVMVLTFSFLVRALRLIKM